MIRRPSRLRTAAIVAVALLALAACTSKKNAAKNPKAEALKLRIGLLFTTSGEGGDLAQAVLGATKLAADDVKDSAGRKVSIEFVQGDYAGDAKQVPKAIESLKGKTDAIVVGTPDPIVLDGLAAISDVPIIQTLIGNDDLTKRDNVFSLAPTNSLIAEKLTDFLVTVRKYKRIVLLTDNTEFGKTGKEAVENALRDLGVEPKLSLVFTPGGDIHTLVAHAGQVDADAVITWVFSPSEAARIVVETQKMSFAYQIALSANLATATFAKNASAQVTPVAFREGMLSVGPWAGPWFPLARIINFYTRFQTENSAQAPVQAAAFYDSVAIIAKAARDAGSVAGQDLVAGLEKITDFEGAGVPVSFGAGDHAGIDIDDLGMYGYTKDQDSAGGQYFPDVDTGGGFFSIVTESLALPARYTFLTTKV
jgi:ABC-type branched-subunit amino acid transport system substrate-binding protein